MVKEILLTKGKKAIVDDKDYSYLSKHKWCVDKIRKNLYAIRVEKKKKIYMHREIMKKFFTDDRKYVDHINNDGLDNRKINLRICNNNENMANSWKKHNTSGLRGVVWDKARKKWISQIVHNYQHIFIGRFNDKEEAGKAYDEKALQFFGKFALLNFPEEVKS